MSGNQFNRDATALAAVFVASALMHLGTFAGLDSDLQTYSMQSMLIFKGWTPYVDFFDIKPPLYFYMLLPGNLLGGRFIHFFIVHLIYVSTLNALVYHAGSRLGGGRLGGLIAWVLYCFSTVVPFFDYGNLNGGIVYATAIFSLGSFWFTMRMLDPARSRAHVSLFAGMAGFLSGLAFATRFGMSQNLVFACAIGYMLIKRRIGPKDALAMCAFYLANLIGVVLAVMALAGWPLKAMYEDLIVFNSLYSGMQGEGITMMQTPAVRVLAALVSIATYARYAVACLLLALILKPITKVFGRKSSHGSPSGSPVVILPWLAIYLLGEFIMIYLQGTGTKQYPYFSLFVPLCLMAGASLDRAIGAMRNPRKLRLIAASASAGLLAISFVFALQGNMEKIETVRQWPEGELISEIKRLAQKDGDLYTLSLAPYLYIESGIAPPRSMNYTHYYPMHWSFAGTMPEREAAAGQRLAAAAPRLIVMNPDMLINQELFDLLENGYALVGTFETSYANMDHALLFVLDKP